MQMDLFGNGTTPLAGNEGAGNKWEPKSTRSNRTMYPPSHRNAPRGTSEVAAAMMAPFTKSQRERIYEAICKAGSRGLTDQEGQKELQISTQSYTPRRGELHKLGLIRYTEERRCTDSGCTAAVWVAVTKRGDLDDA